MTTAACSHARKPAQGTETIRVEAEDGKLNGVEVSTEEKGFSGRGYVTGFDNDADSLEMRFQAKAGLHEMRIAAFLPGGKKGFQYELNGEKGDGMMNDEGPGLRTSVVGRFPLKEGENVIIIRKGWGWYDLDYLEFEPTQPVPLLKVSKKLSDPAADPCAKRLMSFLVDNYGKKMLSGEQELHMAEYAHSMTGKWPAVVNGDFMDYSPSRRERGADPTGKTEKYIAWAEKGGIFGASWHWNAPADLIDKKDNEWWRGFYSDGTTFDFAAALADPSSTRYALLLRDIDAIAVELKKLRDAGVPVLWRPLHEVNGEWFWWGTKGPDSFRKLYRLLHERMTGTHGLHNLIWVYSPIPGRIYDDWYPGDDVVDIVGVDIYTDQSSGMGGQWDEAMRGYNGRKLVTLSESGTLALPEKARDQGVWWSWFSVWEGGFTRKIPKDLFKRVYDDPDVLTLDELPNLSKYPE